MMIIFFENWLSVGSTVSFCQLKPKSRKMLKSHLKQQKLKFAYKKKEFRNHLRRKCLNKADLGHMDLIVI